MILVKQYKSFKQSLTIKYVFYTIRCNFKWHSGKINGDLKLRVI